jgi:threonyl-tRNA synthetase
MCVCRLTTVTKKIGRKIRDNELKRIPYMLIVGEKKLKTVKFRFVARVVVIKTEL